MNIKTLKNDSFKTPIGIGSTKIYGMGEITLSEVGEKCSIGEFSRIRYSVLGSHVKIDRNNFLTHVEIGDNSYTGPFDMIFKCKIGSYTSISYGVTIGPPEHNYSRISTHPFIYDSFYEIFDKEETLLNEKIDRELEIGNDVWIGCNSTILRGIKIGDGAIVGANSLVNKDIPPYAIVAGSPAKIIKFRFSEKVIEKLLDIKWWEWSKDRIKQNSNIFKEAVSLDTLTNLI